MEGKGRAMQGKLNMKNSELIDKIGIHGRIIGKTRRHGINEDMTLHGKIEIVEEKDILFRDNDGFIHIFTFVKDFKIIKNEI